MIPNISESLEVQARGGVLLLRIDDEGEVPNYFNLSPHRLVLVLGGIQLISALLIRLILH